MRCKYERVDPRGRRRQSREGRKGVVQRQFVRHWDVIGNRPCAIYELTFTENQTSYFEDSKEWGKFHSKHKRPSLKYRRNEPHDTNTEDTSTIRMSRCGWI